MVEVFKTNVEALKASKQIIQVLLEQFPSHKINFDLSDCDKILRVEGKNISPDRIIELINSNGFCCEVLVCLKDRKEKTPTKNTHLKTLQANTKVIFLSHQEQLRP